jgi:phage tail-like protein
VQTSDTGITLEQYATYATERTLGRTELPPELEVADFTVGQCHILYILDATAHAVWTFDPNQTRFELIDCIAALLVRPTAVAFRPGTLHIADTQAEERLFALAEVNWQISWTVSSTHDAQGAPLGLGQPFMPIDLTVDTDGNVYALDEANLTVVKFDVAGRLRARFAREALAGGSPVAIAFSREGCVFVLDQHRQRVLQFTTAGQLVNATFIDLTPFGMVPSGLAVDGQGQIFIGDRRPAGRDAEDNRFIRIFAPSGKESGIVAVFRGAVDKLAVDTSERMYLFNRAEQQIVILSLEQTFVRPGGPLPPMGYYFSQAFDSTTPGTQWHKLVLRAAIPANTQVRVSYLIADRVDAFPADAAHTPLEELNALFSSAPLLVNPHDALIRGPVGRYLWLRLQLIGQERLAPTVQSLGGYFPRTSYLRYLPAVYQEEARSRDFLERFLSLFETFLAQLEGRIDHIVRYFDASATDVVVGDFLRWLASWLAITVDEAWSEEQRRTLVQRAPDLYKKRGTREGLAELIAIFTGTQPLIVEHFQLQCAREPAVRQLLARLYGTDPYCFCVLLPVTPGRRDPAQTRQLVRRLVEAEKPAHTCAGILQLQPWVSLDMHTYLGINTYLSGPDPRLDVGAVMPRDMVLTERTAEAGQLERRARLGVDTVLT